MKSPVVAPVIVIKMDGILISYFTIFFFFFLFFSSFFKRMLLSIPIYGTTHIVAREIKRHLHGYIERYIQPVKNKNLSRIQPVYNHE